MQYRTPCFIPSFMLHGYWLLLLRNLVPISCHFLCNMEEVQPTFNKTGKYPNAEQVIKMNKMKRMGEPSEQIWDGNTSGCDGDNGKEGAIKVSYPLFYSFIFVTWILVLRNPVPMFCHFLCDMEEVQPTFNKTNFRNISLSHLKCFIATKMRKYRHECFVS